MSTENAAGEAGKELGGKEFGASVVIEILHQGKLIAGPNTVH